MQQELPEICDSILYDSATIDKRLSELGAEITADYSKILEKGEELVVIAVLKGSYMFAADLTRKFINIPNNIEFLAVSSYSGSTISSGEGLF